MFKYRCLLIILRLCAREQDFNFMPSHVSRHLQFTIFAFKNTFTCSLLALSRLFISSQSLLWRCYRLSLTCDLHFYLIWLWLLLLLLCRMCLFFPPTCFCMLALHVLLSKDCRFCPFRNQLGHLFLEKGMLFAHSRVHCLLSRARQANRRRGVQSASADRCSCVHRCWIRNATFFLKMWIMASKSQCRHGWHSCVFECRSGVDSLDACLTGQCVKRLWGSKFARNP